MGRGIKIEGGRKSTFLHRTGFEASMVAAVGSLSVSAPNFTGTGKTQTDKNSRKSWSFLGSGKEDRLSKLIRVQEVQHLARGRFF